MSEQTNITVDGDSITKDEKTGIITLKPKDGTIKLSSFLEVSAKLSALQEGGYNCVPFQQKDGKTNKVFKGYIASKLISPGTIREVAFGMME